MSNAAPVNPEEANNGKRKRNRLFAGCAALGGCLSLAVIVCCFCQVALPVFDGGYDSSYSSDYDGDSASEPSGSTGSDSSYPEIPISLNEMVIISEYHVPPEDLGPFGMDTMRPAAAEVLHWGEDQGYLDLDEDVAERLVYQLESGLFVDGFAISKPGGGYDNLMAVSVSAGWDEEPDYGMMFLTFQGTEDDPKMILFNQEMTIDFSNAGASISATAQNQIVQSPVPRAGATTMGILAAPYYAPHFACTSGFWDDFNNCLDPLGGLGFVSTSCISAISAAVTLAPTGKGGLAAGVTALLVCSPAVVACTYYGLVDNPPDCRLSGDPVLLADKVYATCFNENSISLDERYSVTVVCTDDRQPFNYETSSYEYSPSIPFSIDIKDCGSNQTTVSGRTGPGTQGGGTIQCKQNERCQDYKNGQAACVAADDSAPPPSVGSGATLTLTGSFQNVDFCRGAQCTVSTNTVSMTFNSEGGLVTGTATVKLSIPGLPCPPMEVTESFSFQGSSDDDGAMSGNVSVTTVGMGYLLKEGVCEEFPVDLSTLAAWEAQYEGGDVQGHITPDDPQDPLIYFTLE